MSLKITLMEVCRQISDQATAMSEKARWSGKHTGDQIMVGQRGVAENIVANHLSALSSAVAKGEHPETAFMRIATELREAIKRWNSHQEWQVQRDKECGQDALRYAFCRLLSVYQNEQVAL